MSTPTPQKRTPAGGPGRVGKASCGWEVYQSSPVDRLLSGLDGVRRTKPGHWIARCPAHKDRHASLAIHEASDGTILLHDFAGCDALSIVRAVGLELRDLFPRPLERSPMTRQERRQAIGYPAALGVLSRESLIVEIAAHDLADGKALAPDDHARLLTACQRIHAAREVLT